MATQTEYKKHAPHMGIYSAHNVGDYRHEIRHIPRGYMVFVNVCEATGGGCSTCAVYPTYWAALEVLGRFRPTAELVERINGAGGPDTL